MTHHVPQRGTRFRVLAVKDRDAQRKLADNAGKGKAQVRIDVDFANGHGSCLAQHVFRNALALPILPPYRLIISYSGMTLDAPCRTMGSWAPSDFFEDIKVVWLPKFIGTGWYQWQWPGCQRPFSRQTLPLLRDRYSWSLRPIP